jgi:hypothetical protein
MKLVRGGVTYRWLVGAAGAVALVCLTCWLVAGGTRGAEIAGDLATAAGLVAAAAAVWPMLPRARADEGSMHAVAIRPATKSGSGFRDPTAGEHVGRWAVGAGHVHTLLLSGNIGLWGPKASGKTCFLAALNAAVAQASPPWTLVGADPAITDALSNLTASMIGRRGFPPATAGVDRFRLVMATELEVLTRRRLSRQRYLLPAQFNLSVLDAGGEYFDDHNMGREGEYYGYSRELVNELANCDGIILFFDSARERDVGDAYQIFQNGAARLEYQLRLSGGLDGSRLPHRVAVCISKFDEPDILDAARAGGHLVVHPDDPYLFPRVADEHAEAFFEQLCRKASNRSAALLNHAIRRYFHPKRIRYFAVSSVGFYLNSSMHFNAADCYNLEGDDRDGWRLRGDIRPINVLEPLLWLADRTG